MPLDHGKSSGWAGGWRPRRRRRLSGIEPSPDFEQFLLDELDSREYARALMRPRKTAGVDIRTKPQGPIARAHEEAEATSDRLRPAVVSRAMRVSPEYLRFLSEEISSSEYADALTESARLDGIYRAPSARFSFPRRGLIELLVDGLRLLFALVGLAIAMLAAGLVVLPLGAKAVEYFMHWAWSMSFVGVVLVALTIRGEALSLLLGLAHNLQRFVSEHLAHQRV